MATKLVTLEAQREPGWLYFVGKDGKAWRTQMQRGTQKRSVKRELVDPAALPVQKKKQYLYFVKNAGKNLAVFEAEMRRN